MVLRFEQLLLVLIFTKKCIKQITKEYAKCLIKCQKERIARNTILPRFDNLSTSPLKLSTRTSIHYNQELSYKLIDLQWCSRKGEKTLKPHTPTKPNLHPLTPMILNRESLLNLTLKLERRMRE